MSTGPVCSTCELHAEAVFRVEGMDCNEEVVILERRPKPLDGKEAAREVRRRKAYDVCDGRWVGMWLAIALGNRLEAASVVFLFAVAQWRGWRALSDTGASVIVVANALRLLRTR
jgi:hypothetical protein